MDERVRVRLEGLIARLTDDPESRSALRALFEGAHARNHLNSYANHALPASQPASHGRSKPSLRVVS